VKAYGKTIKLNRLGYHGDIRIYNGIYRGRFLAPFYFAILRRAILRGFFMRRAMRCDTILYLLIDIFSA